MTKRKKGCTLSKPAKEKTKLVKIWDVDVDNLKEFECPNCGEVFDWNMRTICPKCGIKIEVKLIENQEDAEELAKEQQSKPSTPSQDDIKLKDEILEEYLNSDMSADALILRTISKTRQEEVKKWHDEWNVKYFEDIKKAREEGREEVRKVMNDTIKHEVAIVRRQVFKEADERIERIQKELIRVQDLKGGKIEETKAVSLKG
jgi:uncharacterized Zn finger protein (UPF0148 family)